MIAIEISIIGPNQQPQIWHAVDSDEATAMIRAALSAAAKDWTRIWLRVTGDTTAASCRRQVLADTAEGCYHQFGICNCGFLMLSPGTMGDPRR